MLNGLVTYMFGASESSEMCSDSDKGPVPARNASPLTPLQMQVDEVPLTDKTIDEGDWILVDDDKNASARSSPVFVSEPKIESLADDESGNEDTDTLSEQVKQSDTPSTTMTTRARANRNKPANIAHIMYTASGKDVKLAQTSATSRCKQQQHQTGSASQLHRHNLLAQQHSNKPKTRKKRVKQQLTSGACNDRKSQ